MLIASRPLTEVIDSLELLSPEFWARVVKAEPEACWLWKLKPNPKGYGIFRRKALGRTLQCHRLAWFYLYGEIDPRLVADHLCAVRNCVNPHHLELVTPEVNIARGRSRFLKYCKNVGHELTPDNLIWSTRTDGRRARVCKICRRRQMAQWYLKRKAEGKHD